MGTTTSAHVVELSPASSTLLSVVDNVEATLRPSGSRCKEIRDPKLCYLECGCWWSQEQHECFDNPTSLAIRALTIAGAAALNIAVFKRIAPWITSRWRGFEAARLVYMVSLACALICFCYMWNEMQWNPRFSGPRAREYTKGFWIMIAGVMLYPLAAYAYVEYEAPGLFGAVALGIVVSGVAWISYVHMRNARADRGGGRGRARRDYGNLIAPYYLIFHTMFIEMIVWVAIFWR